MWSKITDGRPAEQLEQQIRALAASYTPEWQFDPKHPDAGAVLAILYAQWLAENVSRFHRGFERFQAEFVNLLGITPRAAQPAASLVRFEMNYDTIPGTMVPKGTKLYANQEDGMIVFETEHSVYVTSAVLRTVFMVSGQERRIRPLFGTFQPLAVIEGRTEAPLLKKELEPFTLFSSAVQGIERFALVLWHKTIFDTREEISLEFAEQEGAFLRAFAKGQIRLMQETASGLVPVTAAVLDGSCLRFRLQEKNKKGGADAAYSALAFVAEKITERISLASVKVSSEGGAQAIQFVSNGASDLDGASFAPFGETLNLYDEVFLGHDVYFSKAGAEVTIRFHLDIKQHLVQLQFPEESGELKIIKRRPKSDSSNYVPETYVQRISLEYYNGKGWRRLVCEEEYEQLFGENRSGEAVLHFTCPSDWEGQNAFGYEGRLLRMQVLKADYCYLFPCCHNYPLITNMTVSYSYEGRAEYPQKLEAVYGTRKVDVTGRLREGAAIVAFEPSAYTEQALYLGFDKRPEHGPVSILFEVQEDNLQTGRTIQFEYSSPKGFLPLRVVDRTDSLRKTGCVRFLPPDNMTSMTLVGKAGYWLRLIEKTGAAKSGDAPVIQNIQWNTAEITNVNTLAEERFYLDEVKADMEFTLAAERILDAQVWVNEADTLTLSQMQQMLCEQPEEVQADYDFRGNIQDFYVRWQEAADFEGAGPSDRLYVLDRWNKRIRFGDGIHVKIPQIIRSTAFWVIVRSCDGAAGNIPARRIEGSLKNLHFVDDVTNLYPAYGGADMEDTRQVLQRGAAVLSGRTRLITSRDYEREILAFSNSVDKVSCISGSDRYGREQEGMICLVLLMKEFEEKTHAFEKLRPRLQAHLLQHCELTVEPAKLRIEEPTFIEISVNVWLELLREEDSLQIAELVRKELTRYLNPIDAEYQYGWEIGRLPRQTQIRMKLNALGAKMRVQKLVVYAAYRDWQGRHECELERLSENPYFVCRSGEHKVHIVSMGELL